LARNGMATLNDSAIAVTQEGRPSLRITAAVFDRSRAGT